jgi:hypothetical protein
MVPAAIAGVVLLLFVFFFTEKKPTYSWFYVAYRE